MGFIRKTVDSQICIFMSCDNCKTLIDSIRVYSLNIPELTEYMRNNNWLSIEAAKINNYKARDYCPKCAVALGINKEMQGVS